MVMSNVALKTLCVCCGQTKPTEQFISRSDEAKLIPVDDPAFLTSVQQTLGLDRQPGTELALTLNTEFHMQMGNVQMQVVARVERSPKALNICYDCMVDRVLPSVFRQLHSSKSCQKASASE